MNKKWMLKYKWSKIFFHFGTDILYTVEKFGTLTFFRNNEIFL